jgi:hypothetical protein
MRRLVTMLAGALVVTSAGADTYWIEYEASSGLFPEQDGSGWTRHHGWPPDERWFEEGWLVLQGMTIPADVDYYEMLMNGALDPQGPDEIFVCRWKVRVDALSLGYYDPGVCISADDNWLVSFSLSLDRVYSDFEPGVSASFEPDVPHTFELRSPNMRTYVLSIDAVPAIAGEFWESLEGSYVAWGDGWYPMGSISRWQFLGFGVISAPLAGDTNCDGTIDFRDINPFVLALTDQNDYQATYPGCWPENSDINGDGSVDFGDINPFIGLLIP